MNYYIDTEFLEGTQKEKFPIYLFRKNTPPTIDLISIGIVTEDGREYYAISKDFNLKEAWNRFQREEETPFEKQNGWKGKKVYWIRENILRPIFDELLSKSIKDNGDFVKNNFFTSFSGFNFSHLESLINYYGKTNKQISEEIKNFTQVAVTKECENGSLIIGATEDMKAIRANFVWDNPKFYAYYADYDWVAFCWLFGKMINLPKGFPMYCIDLKQEFDNEVYLGQVKELYLDLKNHSKYPKQENEHNALSDARWNKKLHEFLNNL